MIVIPTPVAFEAKSRKAPVKKRETVRLNWGLTRRRTLATGVIPAQGLPRSKIRDLGSHTGANGPIGAIGLFGILTHSPGDPPPENATAAKTPVPAGAAAGATNASAGKHPTHKRLESASQASSIDDERA